MEEERRGEDNQGQGASRGRGEMVQEGNGGYKRKRGGRTPPCGALLSSGNSYGNVVVLVNDRQGRGGRGRWDG